MKINKNTIIGLIILAGILIFATFKFFNGDSSEYKLGDNLNADEICSYESFYNGEDLGTLSFCYNNEIFLSIGEESRSKLEVSNIENMFTFYNISDDNTYFYFLNKNGNLYTTTSEKLLNKDISVEKVKDARNITQVKTFTVSKDGASSFGVYAVSENGDLILLKDLY